MTEPPRPIQVRPDLTLGQRLIRTAVAAVLIVAVTVSLIALAESTHANHQAAVQSKEVAMHAAMIARREIGISDQKWCALFNFLLAPRQASLPPQTAEQMQARRLIVRIRDQSKCR